MAEKNALAELANDLELITSGSIPPAMKMRIRKAQRIVAELAKVKTLGPKHVPGDISLYRAYANCRKIAEEGSGDGK